MKVGGIVVVYDPADLDILLSNITTYIGFVDQLLFIDNSDDENLELIRRMPKNCEYHSMHGNIGIADALNFGMDRCKALGCEWVLTMDQDTAFVSDLDGYSVAFGKIICDEVAILSPSISRSVGGLEWIEAKKVIQSGALMNLAVFFEIGGFKSEYFIDYVDYEFCRRAISGYSYKILMLSDVVINHQNGNYYNGSCCGIRYKYKFSSPLRMYYQMRNGLDYIVRYKDWRQLLVLIKLVGKTLLVAGDKRLRFRYLFHGLQDYMNAKWGKYVAR